MDWILKNLVQIVTIVFVIVSIVRAIGQARQNRDRHEDETIDSEEQRRVREIQEQIRRKIAERRGETAAAPPPLARRESAPVETAPPVEREPESPLRRVFEEIERSLQPPQPAPQSAPPPVLAMPAQSQDYTRGELERQLRLREEMQSLEQERRLVERRAANVAAAKLQSSTAARARTADRDRLLADVRDKQSLRRAFLLREVLGPPVGLR